MDDDIFLFRWRLGCALPVSMKESKKNAWFELLRLVGHLAGPLEVEREYLSFRFNSSLD